MKRNILILAVMMVAYLSNLWAYEFSSSISSGQTLYFNIVDGNAQVTFQNNSNPRYTSLSGAIVIPEQVTNSETGNTYTVTSISNNAFTGCTGITSVTFPNTLTSIGNYAFQNCSQLANIDFPSSLVSIGEKAFDACTSLTSITIPTGVTSIGRQAFLGCTSLATVLYNATTCTMSNHDDYPVFSGCTHEAVLTIGENVTRVPNRAFKNFTGLTTVNFPSSLISIGEKAFQGCNRLASVSFPSTLTTIGNSAFDGCSSLVSIALPSQLQSVGSWAFNNCLGLSEITIPASVSTFGNTAFGGCTALTAVRYQGSVAQWCGITFDNENSNPLSMAHNLYMGGNLVEDLVILESVLTIKKYAFRNASCLRSVTLQGGGKSVQERTFEGCTNLEGVYFDGTIEQWCSNSFVKSYVNNADLYWSSNPLYLAHHLYIGDVLSSEHLVIPDNVTTIGSGCFAGGIDWDTITIGAGVVTINEGAFWGCAAKTLYYNCNGLTPSYQSAAQEKPYFLFKSLSQLQSIIVCEGVVRLPNNVFQSTTPNSIILPSTLTTIGSYVFSNCSNLKTIILPAALTSINPYAFSTSPSSNLKTVYNLSGMNIGVNSYGLSATRVVNCSNHGTGANAIHRIDNVNNSTSYSVVADDLAADGQNDAQEIPESTLPDNFIYSNDNGSTWRAKNIVLTDCEDAFNAPEAFIAESATYTRVLTDQNRSTLCLPFTVAKPDDLEVFEYVAFDNSTLSFLELEGENIVAYTPYLVGKNISSAAKATSTFVFSQSNAEFPATSLTEVTHNNMTFKGAMERTPMTSDRNYGYKDGYFVQSGGSAHVNPFRCYFTDNNPQPNPSSLGVDITENDRLGIDEVHPSSQMIIRYSNDVYDLMGRMVRKNAESLRGLPKGIYIWKGQKVINNR